MAITLASANAALARNGLPRYTLIKSQDGDIVLLRNNGGGTPTAIYTGATRVRDLSITEVLGFAMRDTKAAMDEVFDSRTRGELKALGLDLDAPSELPSFKCNGDVRIPDSWKGPAPLSIPDVKDQSVRELYPDHITVPEGEPEVTPAQGFEMKLAFPKEDHTAEEVKTAAESVFGKADFVQTSGSVDFLKESEGRRFAIVDDETAKVFGEKAHERVEAWLREGESITETGKSELKKLIQVLPADVLGSHQDRRSKGPNYPQQYGRAARPAPQPASHGWTLEAPSKKNLANEANIKFIEKHLIAERGGCLPMNAKVFVQRSGSILFRLGDTGVSVKLTDLIGSRFMRDRSPSWWRCNFNNIVRGKPLLIDEHPLTAAKVRENAALLEAFRRSTWSGDYCFMVIFHDGSTELRKSESLRNAFGLINAGERVFIPSADLARYDRELRNGDHGQPLGLSSL